MGVRKMSTVRCFLKGTKEEYEELFGKANVRFGEYHNGVWQVDIRLPSHMSYIEFIIEMES